MFFKICFELKKIIKTIKYDYNKKEDINYLISSKYYLNPNITLLLIMSKTFNKF